MALFTTGLLPDGNILPSGATALSLKQSSASSQENQIRQPNTLTVSLYKAPFSNLNYSLNPQEWLVHGSFVCWLEGWFGHI